MLGDGSAFVKEPQKAAQLASQRSDLAAALASAEDEWLTLSAEAESA